MDTVWLADHWFGAVKAFVVMAATVFLFLGTGYQALAYHDSVESSPLIQRLLGPEGEKPDTRLLMFGKRSRQARRILQKIVDDATQSAADPADPNGDPGDARELQAMAAEAAMDRAVKDLTDLRSWMLLVVGSALLYAAAFWDFVDSIKYP